MGLHARVRCNCIRDGKTKPFPFPGRLGFDKCGEPDLLGQCTLEEVNSFDRWAFDPGCEHHGLLIDVRIGNSAYVNHVRKWVGDTETLIRRKFPVVAGKVVYSGIHSGDCITSVDSKLLSRELEELSAHTVNKITREFVGIMTRLCRASVSTGNPIVF